MRSKTVVATLFAPKKFQYQCSFYLCSQLLYHLNQHLEKPVPMFLLSTSFSYYFNQWDTPRLNSSKGPESFTHSSSTPLPMKRKYSKKTTLSSTYFSELPLHDHIWQIYWLASSFLDQKMSTKIHILIHTNLPTTTQTLATDFAPTKEWTSK